MSLDEVVQLKLTGTAWVILAALMTALFQNYGSEKNRSRAEALRQGMLTVLSQAQGTTSY